MTKINDNRLDFHKKLQSIFPNGKIYFQPDSNIKLSYPCIVYELNYIGTKYAGNSRYISNFRYSVKVISKSPFNDVIDRLLELPYSSYDRHYVADGLNHDVITIFN